MVGSYLSMNKNQPFVLGAARRRKPNRLSIPQIYQSSNWYFVTVCIKHRQNILSHVGANLDSPGEAIIRLSPFGKIIERECLSLKNCYENIELDQFVIMPNHFHGIICFMGESISKFTKKPTNLSKIIKYFKSKTTIEVKHVLESGEFNNLQSQNGESRFAPTIGNKNLYTHFLNAGSIWQKSFYDHVIRNEKDLQNIRQYIIDNPRKWEVDELNVRVYPDSVDS
jgi:putative transposase